MRRSHIFEVCIFAGIIAAMALSVVLFRDMQRHPDTDIYVAHKTTPKPPSDPLIYKRKGRLRIVRAVVQGKLYILVFEHRAGVWQLDGAKRASEIKS